MFFVRLWAVLQGFPPTQGLPEILRTSGTDTSEATVPREQENMIRRSPESSHVRVRQNRTTPEHFAVPTEIPRAT